MGFTLSLCGLRWREGLGERVRLRFNTKAGVKPGEECLGEFRTENHQGPVEYVGETLKDIKHRPHFSSEVACWLNYANDVI